MSRSLGHVRPGVEYGRQLPWVSWSGSWLRLRIGAAGGGGPRPPCHVERGRGCLRVRAALGRGSPRGGAMESVPHPLRAIVSRAAGGGAGSLPHQLWFGDYYVGEHSPIGWHVGSATVRCCA